MTSMPKVSRDMPEVPWIHAGSDRPDGHLAKRTAPSGNHEPRDMRESINSRAPGQNVGDDDKYLR